MRKFFGYIAVVTVIFAMTLSCRRARVIPKDTLTDIYVEMLLADQWIVLTGISMMSDTHFVYRPIFEKYGYTADDYRFSVQTYLRDPEEYAKLFAGVEKKLSDRVDVLDGLENVRRRQDSIKYANNMRWRNIPKPVLYKDVLKGQFPSDTVCFGPDSARYTINIPVLDTMFSGPRLVIRNEGTMDMEEVDAAEETVAEEERDIVEKEMKPLPLDREKSAPLPLGKPETKKELSNDARRPGLRTDIQQEIGRLSRD